MRRWALLLLACSCGQEQARREEAARVSEAVEALIMADRRGKGPMVDRLKATPCSLPEVCEARRLCVLAFEPVAQAAALQIEAREMLDRADPALAPQIDQKLDQAERLNAQARKLTEPCLSSTTHLRQAHKL